MTQRFQGNGATGEGRSLADLLREHRLLAGLTQKELGDRAGLSARTISDIERGIHKAPFRYTLDAVASALALSPGQTRDLENAIRRSRGLGRAVTEQPVRTIPLPFVPVFGREEELDYCTALLLREQVGLLTLTGIAGVGKTRLAIELGQRLRLGAGRSVTLVRLENVNANGDLLGPVAASLGLAREEGPYLADHVAASLADRPSALILDHLEAEADTALQLLEVLSLCQDLQIIVTGRVALGVPDEHVCTVAPFYQEGVSGDLSLEEIASLPAVQMFVGVARAGGTGFMLTQRAAPAVLEIISRLDGLPAAIEMAAAQTAVLTPQEILTGLRQSSSASGPQLVDSPEFPRAILDVLRWSYASLTPAEQRLLRWCSVFPTDWTLDRLAAFVSVDPSEYSSLVEPLVTWGLLQRSVSPDGQSRFRMPRFVKEFAHAELVLRDELEEANESLAGFVSRVVEESPFELQLLIGARPGSLLDAYEEDIKACLEWLLVSGRVDEGVRLLWRVRYSSLPARHWVGRWLETARDAIAGSDPATEAMLSALLTGRATGFRSPQPLLPLSRPVNGLRLSSLHSWRDRCSALPWHNSGLV